MEKSSQSPATTQETQAPATPGRLDGVVIDSCVFTESVGKREPRPPLFNSTYSRCGHFDPVVTLFVPGGKRIVKLRPASCEVCGTPNARIHLGQYCPGEPKGPAYTGPITPAMWAIIRKFWNP